MNIFNISFGFVGLGLMGGSMAKAIRNLGPKNICAIDFSKDALEKACKDKTIDFIAKNEDDIIANSDVLILGIYPEDEIEFLKRNMNKIKKNILITDLSGLKRKLIESVIPYIPSNVEFISAHPMCGKEINGYENSTEKLFIDKNLVITIHEKNKNDEKIRFIINLYKEIGIKNIIKCSIEKHDELISYTSHIPHLLAVALCMDENFNKSKDFIGTSFKDVSRVANINEELWSRLFMENSKNVIKSMDEFILNFSYIKKLIENNKEDELKSILKLSRLRKEEVHYNENKSGS